MLKEDKTIIDLAVSLTAGIASDPPGLGPQIDYIDHDQGAREFEEIFGIPVDQQLEGKGAAVERCVMSTHTGTHMDAPWHYHPTMDGGKRAMTIDEVPLEWCVGPGVKLDFRALPDGHLVTAVEVEAELQRIGHHLTSGDIVLINTRAGERYGEDDYVASGCGMGREATLYLTRHGVKVAGTDAWSWDPPLATQVARVHESGNPSLFWEGHKAGADTVFCHMEKLANLNQLPDTGFDVICLPVKIARASAGWCRPIALVPAQ
ncbi:cyclase family protein [Halomonas sp. V046]|uniref:cyclase family protein n=1 Tax=Halomonas sp. V046 TaxID=3459611 RepID=UPI004043D111